MLAEEHACEFLESLRREPRGKVIRAAIEKTLVWHSGRRVSDRIKFLESKKVGAQKRGAGKYVVRYDEVIENTEGEKRHFLDSLSENQIYDDPSVGTLQFKESEDLIELCDKKRFAENSLEGKYHSELVRQFGPAKTKVIEHLLSKSTPGMNYSEIAKVTGVSEITVKRTMEIATKDPESLANIFSKA